MASSNSAGPADLVVSSMLNLDEVTVWSPSAPQTGQQQQGGRIVIPPIIIKGGVPGGGDGGGGDEGGNVPGLGGDDPDDPFGDCEDPGIVEGAEGGPAEPGESPIDDDDDDESEDEEGECEDTGREEEQDDESNDNNSRGGHPQYEAPRGDPIS